MKFGFLVVFLAASFVFAGSVEIQSRLTNGNLFGNEMQLQLRIYNSSGTKLDLSKANLVYRFSDNDNLSKFAYDIWWFSNGNTSDAKISFHEYSPNEKYFKLYFTGGEIANGNYAEIQLRVRKTDWSFFSMINDYSLPAGTEWAVNPNITFTDSSSVIPTIPILPLDSSSAKPELAFDFPDILLSLGDYAIFGTNEVRLADRVSASSDVGTGNYTEIGANSRVIGNLHSKKSAFLRERAQIFGNLRVGENYTTQNSVYIEGEKITGKPIPDFKVPSQNDLKAGTVDVIIGNYEIRNLEPGTYRDLAAYSNSTLNLKPGKYIFRNFRLEPEVKLKLDVSGGIIEIIALETVTFSDRVAISYENGSTNPLAFRVYQHGSSDLRIGTDLSIGGYFTAPDASIRVSSRVKFAGWLHGKNIYIEPDTKLCEPPVLSGLTHSKVAYAPEFSALTPEYRTAKAGDLEVFAKAKDKNTIVDIYRDGSKFKVKLYNAEKANMHPWCAQTEYTLSAVGGETPVYVKENSECSGNSCDGSGWGKAFKNLQKGLESAKTQGKAVWLAEGNYNADSVLRIGMGTEIIGGFKGENGEILETRSGGVSETVINGNGNNTLLFFGGNGLPYAAYLDMATVTKGNIFSAYAAPILDYLVIKNNNIKAEGGGVYSVNSDAIKITNSYIVGCKASLGGALFVKGGSLVLENAIVSSNEAENGAAIYAENAKLKIRYATIADNSAQAGKGIAFIGGVNTETANNIVWNNGGSDLEITAQNPLFKTAVPAAGEDGLFFTKDDGYALSDDSPMIDKGVKLADIPIDIFGMDRTISKDGSEKPDMGAREWFLDLAKNFKFLKETATKGLQPVEKPTILKESSSDYLPLKLLNTPYAYILSAKIPKNKYMKDKHSGNVRILTKDKKSCSEAKNVTFYRFAEENGMVEYRTYRNESEGIYLFLAQKEMPSYDWYHVLKVCEGGFHVQIEAFK
jgi:hypothetical protein